MDIFPVLSQGKSFVQWASGDSDGAYQTQQNFLRGCPVISQATSATQALYGDYDGAYDTQRYFVENVSHAVDAIPVVGHAKGGIHYACGDSWGGDYAMRSASRTTGVLAGGLAGSLAGPAGAIAGGIAGGAAADGIITGVESGINGSYKPYGYVETGTKIYNGRMTSGDYYDAAGGLVFDGLGGRGGAKLGKAIHQNRTFKKAIPQTEIPRRTAAHIMKDQSRDLQRRASALKTVPEFKPAGTTSTILIEADTYRQHKGYSNSMRRHMSTDNNPFPNGAQSRLQQAVPTVRSVGKRPLNTCAEHQAFQTVPTGRRVAAHTSLQLEGTGRKTYPVAPCGNCKQYGKTIGDSITGPMDRGPKVPNKLYLPDSGLRTRAAGRSSAALGSEPRRPTFRKAKSEESGCVIS